MNAGIRRLSVLIAAAVLAGAAGAQSAPAPGQPSVKIHKTAGEVMVDLVVTDAHGKIIQNVQPSQLQVLDNNQPQTISSFRVVSHSVDLSNSQMLRAGLSTALRPQPFNLVVMVFDRMGNADRYLAKQTADYYVQHMLGPRDYVAVYDINQILYALQNFTTQKPALLKAIATATGGSSSAYRQMALDGQTLMTQAVAEQQAAEGNLSSIGSGGGPSAGAPAGAGASLVDALMNRIIARSLLSAASMKGQQASWATLTALRSIVDSMQTLPGRKELLYFSTNLPVDANTGFMLRNLFRDSNRAEVSFYPIDPAGLNQQSSASQMTQSLSYAESVSQSQRSTGTVSSAQANEFQTVSNIRFAGRLTTMSEIAAETGGFLSAHTNNLEPFMQRLAADISSHYEITYTPSSGLNGAYHTIAVKVIGHPDWLVRARKGYYAIPQVASPVEAYALPAMALLQSAQPPRDLPMATTNFEFPVNPAMPTVDLMTTVPLGGLKAFPVTPAQALQNPSMKGKSLVQLVVLQVVRDQQQQIVQNFSQQYEWSVGAAGLAQLKRKNVVFNKMTTLPQGDYTVQTAIYEPQDHAASVIQEPLHVAAAAPNSLRLSSIVVVQSTRKLNAIPAAYDPFNYIDQGQATHIFPNSTHVMQAEPGNPNAVLGFYFIAYVPKGLPQPKLTMTFSVGGTPIGSPSVMLPAPDAQGRIPYIANIPSASLPAGTYGLKLTLQAGTQTATRSTRFEIIAPKPAGAR